MARLLTEGFESGDWGYSSGGVIRGGGSTHSVQDTVVRSGDYAMKTSFAALGTYSYVQQLVNGDVFYIRWAWRHDWPGGEVATSGLLRLMEGGSNHVVMMIDQETLIPYLDVLGSTVDTATVILPSNQWMILEAYVKIANSGGAVTIKLNGTTILSYSGDTCHGSNEYATSIHIGVLNSGPSYNNYWLDDIAINDDSGSYQNSWVGMGGIIALRPTADGNTNDWSRSEGSDNYALVDETPADGAAWVQALTSGDLDQYEIEDTPDYVDSIDLVEIVVQAALSESGSNDLGFTMRQASSDYDDTQEYTVVSVIDDYVMYKGDTHYVQPDGSGAWTEAKLDALEIGVNIP